MSTDAHAEQFTELRALLFTIVYEILGSATEADDVLQDSYLRWSAVDLAIVRDTKAYLAQLVTRQALNARRASVRRREDYVGPWLPEPLLATGPEDDESLAESVSMAMLVVLETLGAEERAVFVLREVFGFSHAEIADAVGRSTPAVRQIAHRAREHVHARRRRFSPARSTETTRVVEQFMAAVSTGDLDGLLATLAPDVVWTADGGGKATAARRPIVGAERTATMLLGLVRQLGRMDDARIEPVVCNGMPAMIVQRGDRSEGVYVIEVGDGVITNFYAIRNPDKLAAVGVHRTITR